jgi:hypothetical protein
MTGLYNVNQAARALGISRTATVNRAKKAGLSFPLSQKELESIRKWKKPGQK